MKRRSDGTVTLNDNDREEWIKNDEGLHDWYRQSRLSMRAFIRQNRSDIDAAIIPALEGTKSAHHLKYDRFRN